MKQYVGWFVRGMGMGAADAVPGVSGGTIALITGIYERLMTALASFDLKSVQLLLKGRIKELWFRHDAPFLVSVFSGVLLAVLVFASLVTWLLDHYPPAVWAFFSGLIAISAILLLRDYRPKSILHGLMLLGGLLFAACLAFVNPVSASVNLVTIFFGGMLAVCAMILPGISGSFILLLLGLYLPVLNGVKAFDFAIIGTMLAGCITGLLVFSKLLHYLLEKYHQATLCLLTGVVIGSLVKLWPWQALQGESNLWLLPQEYELVVNQSAFLAICAITFILGAALVSLADRFSNTD